MQRVKSMKELFLRAFLSYNKLDIIDQKNVVVPVFLPEFRGGNIIFIESPKEIGMINFIRKLILSVDKELSNFPKKDIELKNRIRNNSYDILELSYEANNSKNIENKEMLLGKIIAKIKILDFLLNLCYDKMIINNKKYIKFGENIDDIIRYTTGWMKSIKQ